MIRVKLSNREHYGLKALLVVNERAMYLCDHEPAIGDAEVDDRAFQVFVQRWEEHAKALGVPFKLDEGLERYLKDSHDVGGQEASAQGARVRPQG